MLVRPFSNKIIYVQIVGNIPDQHLNVWVFSNLGDKVQKRWKTTGKICPVLSTGIWTLSPGLENDILRESSPPPHQSHVICHVSCVSCHMSQCYVSHVTSDVIVVGFFSESGETSWWRIFYQWGLPCLVTVDLVNPRGCF